MDYLMEKLYIVRTYFQQENAISEKLLWHQDPPENELKYRWSFFPNFDKIRKILRNWRVY